MSEDKIEEIDFPALYQAADKASLAAQKKYFLGLFFYLVLLVIAALVSFAWPKDSLGAISSATLFLITLGILIWLKVQKPEDTWYNGRAVAESVKTRSWRWMMRAEPYDHSVNLEQVSKEFLSDLKSILAQNRSLSGSLNWLPDLSAAITTKMQNIRSLPLGSRLQKYKTERIDNQSKWYSKKSLLNKKRAKQWFFVSIFLHSVAVLLLLWRIKEPNTNLPIEVVATAASAVLTWLQAKKHNELNSSYSLAAHEIVLIKGESVSVKTEETFSEFVVNSEAAFSREHTQWTARKNV